jgi:hypothetical protein
MSTPLITPLSSQDRDRLRAQFAAAAPFPHVVLDNFLDPAEAARVAAAYPTFERARSLGDEFKGVNEHGKIQITDAARFPAAVQALNAALGSDAFLADLSHITGIEGLRYDPTLAGGGIHVTGPRGRLDVHVDFNHLESQQLYRRLNLLLYLNPTWEDGWGGGVELWDPSVTRCEQRLAPVLNRCVLFETSERSFHGVEEVRCPPGVVRQSFAVYYYTEQPPADYRGVDHTTIFRARPDERLKRYVLMPAERALLQVKAQGQRVRRVKERLTRLVSP